jgi:hypothetical protein
MAHNIIHCYFGAMTQVMVPMLWVVSGRACSLKQTRKHGCGLAAMWYF